METISTDYSREVFFAHTEDGLITAELLKISYLFYSEVWQDRSIEGSIPIIKYEYLFNK